MKGNEMNNQRINKHTPTPWKATRNGADYFDINRTDGVLGDVAAVWNSNGRTGEENAAFIVRACNAHDELVKAVKDVVKAFDLANKISQEVRMASKSQLMEMLANHANAEQRLRAVLTKLEAPHE